MSIKSIKYSSLENSIADSQEKSFDVDYLVVAGGGSGAGGTGSYSSNDRKTGGGGAGGYLTSFSGDSSGGGNSATQPIKVQLGQSYKVEVGAGATYSSFSMGGDSQFDTVISVGGGHGG